MRNLSHYCNKILGEINLRKEVFAVGYTLRASVMEEKAWRQEPGFVDHTSSTAVRKQREKTAGDQSTLSLSTPGA